MASRKPIVMVSGQASEIPTADTLTVPAVSIGNTAPVKLSIIGNDITYTQFGMQPGDGNRALVAMFAPSGTSTAAVLEFYSSSAFTTTSRHIFKNTAGLLQIGGDAASLDVEFIRSNTAVFSIRSTGPKVDAGLSNYANDAAAATGGIPVGGFYRNGSAVMIRVA